MMDPRLLIALALSLVLASACSSGAPTPARPVHVRTAALVTPGPGWTAGPEHGRNDALMGRRPPDADPLDEVTVIRGREQLWITNGRPREYTSLTIRTRSRDRSR